MSDVAMMAVAILGSWGAGGCDYPAKEPGLEEVAGDITSASDSDGASLSETQTPDGATETVSDTTTVDTTTVDTAVQDTAVATDSGAATDTLAPETTPETTAPEDTQPQVEPEIEDDPSMPGPLPDMGLPPLGYLGSPPFGATSTTCGTASWWWGYTLGSENMQPGGACIDCHNEKGPDFSFAGTVMADYNDADECRGIPGVTVEIIDRDGRVALTMVSNGAGNFFSESMVPVAMPYTARISLDGRTREMDEPVDHGDCNACHTSTGAEDAPGRIVLP